MKRNYYHEALAILDLKYPELELETFRFVDEFLVNSLAETKHLKALHDKINEILDREEKTDNKLAKILQENKELKAKLYAYDKALLELTERYRGEFKMKYLVYDFLTKKKLVLKLGTSRFNEVMARGGKIIKAV